MCYVIDKCAKTVFKKRRTRNMYRNYRICYVRDRSLLLAEAGLSLSLSLYIYIYI